MIMDGDNAPDIAQDNTTDDAIADAADDAIDVAAAEYRSSGAYGNLTKPTRQHFDRAMRTIKSHEAQQFKFAQMDGAGVWEERLRLGNFTFTGEPSEKTERIIDSIRTKQPKAFAYGARCGFYCAVHDAELFAHWTTYEREAFFAGYTYGRNQRLHVSSVREAAE